MTIDQYCMHNVATGIMKMIKLSGIVSPRIQTDPCHTFYFNPIMGVP